LLINESSFPARKIAQEFCEDRLAIAAQLADARAFMKSHDHARSDQRSRYLAPLHILALVVGLAACAQADASRPPSNHPDLAVYFEHGENKLTPEEIVKVGEAVAKLKSEPATKVLIVGHADATGPEKLNDLIARERAEHVGELILHEHPEFAARIRVASVGEKGARVDHPGESAQDRAKDRRVSLHYYAPDQLSDEETTLKALFSGQIRLHASTASE
jgi:outer membrane protein OmpA-like peptidoglycan-associated protein